MSVVIRFNYLHRDSGNYKKFGSKEFSNPEQLCVDEIEPLIRQNLIDQEYFYPDPQVSNSDLHLYFFDHEVIFFHHDLTLPFK